MRGARGSVRIAGDSTPALVLGGPLATALAVVRGLGRAGIAQYAVGTGGSFVAASRWHRALPASPGTPLTAASLARLLEAQPLERAVLFPCSDEWALAVAALPPALAARFPASLAPLASVETLVDKAKLAELLARLDIPHPPTVPIRAAADLVGLPDAVLQAGFLKPRHSQAFARRYGVKAFRFRTRAEAVTLARKAEGAGLDLLLQEYVPGPPTRHFMIEGFVDAAGRVRARFVRQRLRMHPPEFGDSTYMVTRALDSVAAAVEPLDRLLAALRYRGMFEAEFKYDDRDARFKLLEVNARPWLFLGFAAACGVDFCVMAYRDALGLPVDPVERYPVGRRFLVPSLDAQGCWRLLREGSLTPWGWMRSWLGAGQLVFAWDDPVPGLVSPGAGLGRVIRRRARRLVGSA